MLSFFAQIRRDPDGYVWEPLSSYMLPETHDRYPDSIVLRAKSHKALLEEFRRDGGVLRTNCYDPFVEEPALFRIFAALDPTREGIVKFANQYGDVTTFDEVIEDGGISLRNWGMMSGWFKDAIAKAEQLLARPVSPRNQKKYAQAVAEFIDPYLTQLPVYLMAVALNGAISLRAEPRNLIDVMKIQLIESVVERKRYRNCEQCSKPFEVTPQVNRSDRIYCSDNCRVKAYQRRRKQAIERRRAGQTLREISKSLRSDMQTVKKWVQDLKRKE